MDRPRPGEKETVSRQPQLAAPDSGILRTRLGGLESAQPGREELPPGLARLLQRHPAWRRHPHPIVVHFTIVYLLSTTFFSLLYLLTRIPSLETTAYYCLGAGVLSIPFTILTGHLSRRLNYPEAPRRVFLIEIRLSWLLLGAGAAAFLWRTLNPGILQNLGGAGLLYLLLIMSLSVIVTIISFFGGLLTFPLEKD
jgi:uncharacterized membrane protein